MLTFNEFLAGCDDDFIAMLQYNEMTLHDYYDMIKCDIESQDYNDQLERLAAL